MYLQTSSIAFKWKTSLSKNLAVLPTFSLIGFFFSSWIFKNLISVAIVKKQMLNSRMVFCIYYFVSSNNASFEDTISWIDIGCICIIEPILSYSIHLYCFLTPKIDLLSTNSRSFFP